MGWKVTYGEEFVPNEEFIYTIIIQKVKTIVVNEELVRISFKIWRPGERKVIGTKT